jgi:A/G-specific adenine glycosylase
MNEAWSKQLIEWYCGARRDLPWRRTRDPYAIWVSEIMLQQTQVATVIPFYERFMARFPTLEALATAPEDDVLRLWAGLGYYSRARNLQRGAQEVLARHHGRVPEAVDDLLGLPGVGRYTAGAIASVAYNQPAPILDGNVIRVLCRLYGLRGDPKRAPLHGRLWQLAEENIPPDHAGEFNQAMMELGATVCTPRSPRCNACPIAPACEARRLGIQEALPELARAPAPTPLRMAAAVVWRGTEVLLVKRDPAMASSRLAASPMQEKVAEGRAAYQIEEGRGWWAGMWQFPSGEVRPGESTADAVARLVREAAGIEVEPGGVAGVVRHGVTRWKVTLEARHCRPADGDSPPKPGAAGADWAWVKLDDLERFALPAPQRRLVEQIRRQMTDGQQPAVEQPLLIDV